MQEDQRLIGILKISRLDQPLDGPVLLRRLCSQPLLPLGDHLQHLAPSGTVAGNCILVGLVLQGLLNRDLARFAVVRHREGPIDHNVKGGGRAIALRARPSLWDCRSHPCGSDTDVRSAQPRSASWKLVPIAALSQEQALDFTAAVCEGVSDNARSQSPPYPHRLDKR
jgi:hypothetical protein